MIDILLLTVVIQSNTRQENWIYNISKCHPLPKKIAPCHTIHKESSGCRRLARIFFRVFNFIFKQKLYTLSMAIINGINNHQIMRLTLWYLFIQNKISRFIIFFCMNASDGGGCFGYWNTWNTPFWPLLRHCRVGDMILIDIL